MDNVCVRQHMISSFALFLSSQFAQRFTTPLKAFTQHLTVSYDGEYIALSGVVDESLALVVYRKSTGTKLEYTVHPLAVSIFLYFKRSRRHCSACFKEKIVM